MTRRAALIQSVPIVCQKLAGLAVLADLARRRNSNLRAVNGGRGTKSVPGHHILNCSVRRHGQSKDFSYPHSGCERDQYDHAQPVKRTVDLPRVGSIHFLIERTLKGADLSAER